MSTEKKKTKNWDYVMDRFKPIDQLGRADIFAVLSGPIHEGGVYWSSSLGAVRWHRLSLK